MRRHAVLVAGLTMVMVGQGALADGPERELTAVAAADDVRVLRSTIERVHPGYGRFTSAAAMDRLFDDLERSVARGTTDARLYLEVSRLLAHLRCDHTKAELSPSIEEHRRSTPTHLPFGFRLFDGRMYVDRVDGVDGTGLARGDEVLAINGRPVGRILADVAPLVSVDGWTDHAKRIEMEHSSEYLGDAVDHFWPFLYGWPSSWTIEARDRASGAVKVVERAPLTYDAWLALTTEGASRYVDFPDTVEFRMIDERTGYLSIGTFVNYRRPVAPASVFDPVFDALRDAGAERLIIDLRDCGGGSDDVPAALRSYLSPVVAPSSRRPPWVRTYEFGELRQYLSTWDESVFNMPADLFEDLGNGYYQMRQPVAEQRPSDRSNRFDGELIVLSGAGNASGATILIALLQAHAGARIVGEPTGGSAEGPTAGVILFLTLPTSGIVVRVPALRSWVNVPEPPAGMGVVPDIMVGQGVDDWLGGRDTVLEAALAVPAKVSDGR